MSDKLRLNNFLSDMSINPNANPASHHNGILNMIKSYVNFYRDLLLEDYGFSDQLLRSLQTHFIIECDTAIPFVAVGASFVCAVVTDQDFHNLIAEIVNRIAMQN
jgi:hypothetical protein